MGTNVKKITEASMMVALVGVALIINRQTGMVFEFILYWFMAFPILIYSAKYGLKSALLPLLGMLVVGFLFAAPQTIFYLGISLLIGIVYGEGVRKHWSNQKLMFYTMGVSLVSYFFTTVLFAGFFGYDLTSDLAMIHEFFSSLDIALPIATGDFILMLALLTTILTALMEGLVIHLFAMVLLKRLKIETQPMQNLFDLRLSKWFGYGSIAVVILQMTMNLFTMSNALKNGIMFLYMIVFLVNILYGVTVAMCFLVVLGKRKHLIWLVLAIFLPFVNSLLMFLGIFDSIKDIKSDLKRGILNGSIGKN